MDILRDNYAVILHSRPSRQHEYIDWERKFDFMREHLEDRGLMQKG